MTKRLPSKGPQPWPAFPLVAVVMTAVALVSTLLLEAVNAGRGERSYIFTAAAKAPARPAAPAPPPAKKPAGKQEPKPTERLEPKHPEKPVHKTLEEARAQQAASRFVYRQ